MAKISLEEYKVQAMGQIDEGEEEDIEKKKNKKTNRHQKDSFKSD